MPRVPDWSEKTVLARKLPDGRLEVIGELVGEVEWRMEVARRAAEDLIDDAADWDEEDEDGFDSEPWD